MFEQLSCTVVYLFCVADVLTFSHLCSIVESRQNRPCLLRVILALGQGMLFILCSLIMCQVYILLHESEHTSPSCNFGLLRTRNIISPGDLLN